MPVEFTNHFDGHLPYTGTGLVPLLPLGGVLLLAGCLLAARRRTG